MGEINSYLISKNFSDTKAKNQILEIIKNTSSMNRLPCLMNLSQNTLNAIDRCIQHADRFKKSFDKVEKFEMVFRFGANKKDEYDSMSHDARNKPKVDLMIAPGWGAKANASEPMKFYKKTKVLLE